jgi:hypothetical protein
MSARVRERLSPLHRSAIYLQMQRRDTIHNGRTIIKNAVERWRRCSGKAYAFPADSANFLKRIDRRDRIAASQPNHQSRANAMMIGESISGGGVEELER